MTLPSQGRVHRSPEPPGALLSRILINLISSIATDRREETSLLSVAICGKSKFYKYLDRGFFQLPGREVLLFRATWREPRSDEHRRTRRRAGRFRGTGDPTLPG